MGDPASSAMRLGGVAETLLIPLYFRALEARRPDAILRDERAAAIVEDLDYDFTGIQQIRASEGNKIARFMLTREIDRRVVAFLQAHPDGVVVHVGCGLDARFERVDNGQVEWFDLDLPEVVALRRRFVGDERERYHLLAGSVFDDAWRDAVAATGPRPVLFVAEAVLVYFDEEQVRSLLVELCERFPGSELIFDAWSPLFVRMGNFQLAPSGLGGTMKWGFWRAGRLEKWAEGLRLVGEWGFFDEPEPRMAPYRWAAPLFRLFKPIRVLQYRLGRGESAAADPPERISVGGWLGVVAFYLIVPLILLLEARDPGWWQAWAYSLLLLVVGVGGRVLADRRHPGLQADRMKFGRGQQVKRWDRVLAPLMGLSLIYPLVVVAGLDHARGWTTPLSAWANVVGLLLCALGYGFAVWALVENRFFTSTVRIQTERGHEVCDSGPYRLVRHPGYAGNLLPLVGVPLALGSAWASVPAAFALVVSVVRTALEDRTLQEELPGYREYARRVRYRLFPGIW